MALLIISTLPQITFDMQNLHMFILFDKLLFFIINICRNTVENHFDNKYFFIINICRNTVENHFDNKKNVISGAVSLLNLSSVALYFWEAPSFDYPSSGMWRHCSAHHNMES